MLRKRRGLIIVLGAVLTLVIISAVQFRYMQEAMYRELEKHAEQELTLKAILTKNIISTSEMMLKSHIMEVKRCLQKPDSIYHVNYWIVKSLPVIQGCGISFVPNYYPDRGRLFEPYALRTDSGIVNLQVAGELFDYTIDGFYKTVIEKKVNTWVGPYHDKVLKEPLISYAVPIYNSKNDTIAVFGIDISTRVFSDTLNQRHIYPSSFVVLLTEDGQLIAGSSEGKLREEVNHVVSVINDSTIEKKLSTSGHSTVVPIRNAQSGATGNLFYANLRGNPHWQIAVVCYDDEVYASLYHMRSRLWLLMLAAFLVLGAIVWFVFRNIQRLQWVTLRNERLGSELRIAKSIQQNMLPRQVDNSSGRSIDRTDVTIRGSLVPAKEVGGDLYDHFIRDEKLYFCIGDVSGKGVPSALVMAMAHSLFRSTAQRESNPAHIMRAINEENCQNNENNMFATLFIGVLDLPSGKLRYCNAGHDSPIVVPPVGEQTLPQALPAKTNIPVGVFSDYLYKAQECVLKPGTMLFLYTDGLTEARNTTGEFLGQKRVNEAVARYSSGIERSPESLLQMLTATEEQFAQGADQSDDLTMLAMVYTPQESKQIMNQTLVLKNNLSEVKRLNAFVADVTSTLDIEPSLGKKLKLAVEEAVVNVIDYAYKPGVDGQITLTAQSDGHTLKFTIKDSGTPFDPTEMAKADTSLSAEDRPIGGLGILLVRELMDTINYEYTNDQNVLTLSKKL